MAKPYLKMYHNLNLNSPGSLSTKVHYYSIGYSRSREFRVNFRGLFSCSPRYPEALIAGKRISIYSIPFLVFWKFHESWPWSFWFECRKNSFKWWYKFLGPLQSRTLQGLFFFSPPSFPRFAGSPGSPINEEAVIWKESPRKLVDSNYLRFRGVFVHT